MNVKLDENLPESLHCGHWATTSIMSAWKDWLEAKIRMSGKPLNIRNAVSSLRILIFPTFTVLRREHIMAWSRFVCGYRGVTH